MFHIDSNSIWMERVFQTIVCSEGPRWIFSFYCRHKRLMGGRPRWTEESNSQFLNNSIFAHLHVKRVIKKKGWKRRRLKHIVLGRLEQFPLLGERKTLLQEEMNATFAQEGKSLLFYFNDMLLCVRSSALLHETWAEISEEFIFNDALL